MEALVAAPSSPATSLATSSASSCPVLHAWAQSEVILKRLLDKDLLVLSGSRLTRATVCANSDLLIPLLNLVGN